VSSPAAKSTTWRHPAAQVDLPELFAFKETVLAIDGRSGNSGGAAATNAAAKTLRSRRWSRRPLLAKIDRDDRARTPRRRAVLRDRRHELVLHDFKTINDRYGHAAGDSLLIEASRRIRGASRTADQLGRIGGDEFLVLCPNVAEAEAKRVAERLRAALHISVTIGEQQSEIRAAVGVAGTAHDTTADGLIAIADERMYAAKSHQQDHVGA
jgi:diguanylate cyclase (GGDEF)-like protein